MSLSILLPAYKEEENLSFLLPEINFILDKEKIQYSMLVIDTIDPTDNTQAVCQENNAIYIPRVHGDLYGDAIRTGVLNSTSNWTIVMDADGSHNPEDIIRLYREAQKGYDIVIGSRYIAGGSTHNGIILRAMSYIVNKIYKTVFQINAKDISNSFRIYNTEKLKSLKLACNNFDIVEEIIILFGVKYPSYKLKEIPIYFNQRIHGESKRNLVKFSVSYIQSVFRLLNIRRKARKS